MSQRSGGTSGTWVRPSVRNPPSCPGDWSPGRGRASHPPMTHLRVAKVLEFTRIYMYFAMFKLKKRTGWKYPQLANPERQKAVGQLSGAGGVAFGLDWGWGRVPSWG